VSKKLSFDAAMKAGLSAFEMANGGVDWANEPKFGSSESFHRLVRTPRQQELYEMHRLAEMCATGVKIAMEVKRALAADEAARAAKSPR